MNETQRFIRCFSFSDLIVVFSGTFVEPEVDLRFDRNVSKIKEVIKEKLEVGFLIEFRELADRS